MDHASRSARGHVETKSLPTLGPDDRVCERELDESRVYIYVVEQSSAQVSSHTFYVASHNDLTVRFLCAALGRVWDVRQMQNVLVSPPFFVLMRSSAQFTYERAGTARWHS